MNTKMIVLIVVLLIGIGIAAYMWTSASKDAAGDQGVMAQMENYTCQKCGATFQKSVQESTDELRANDGHISCPKCGAKDPDKEGVKVRMSGMGGGASGEAKTFDSDDKAGEEAEEEQPTDEPKVAPPGMKKKKG